MILHIPHASTTIHADIRATLLLTDTQLAQELLWMTDHYTDQLFDPPLPTQRIIAPTSRLVCDVERFPDDEDEPMAATGMGAIYTRTSDAKVLRHLTPAARQQLMRNYYEPHHAQLGAAVDAELLEDGRCLIIDCHSFPAKPLPYERDQQANRPQICLGTDAFHTPAWLLELARRAFEKSGFSVAIDTPFAGTLVPLKHYRRTPAVLSLMIECNRALYMDEETGEKNEIGFIRLKKAIDGFLTTMHRLAGTRGAPE